MIKYKKKNDLTCRKVMLLFESLSTMTTGSPGFSVQLSYEESFMTEAESFANKVLKRSSSIVSFTRVSSKCILNRHVPKNQHRSVIFKEKKRNFILSLSLFIFHENKQFSLMWNCGIVRIKGRSQWGESFFIANTTNLSCTPPRF